MQVKKQQLELDMEQQTGSKSEEEYIKAVYLTAYINIQPCLFNLYAEYIMWNAGLDEAQVEIKIARRKKRLPGEISITSDMQMTPPYGRKWRTKEPL